MNIKYSTSEMNFEGLFPIDYPHLRVFETQLLFLDAYHLPLYKILNENKIYDGDLLFNIGKGDFNKDYIKNLYIHYHNIVELLKSKFNNVYIYQDGEVGWWNQVDVKLQTWWFNQLNDSDGIFVPNEYDKSFYKGIFLNKKVGVMRSVMTDDGLDKSKFKPKSNRVIINGPLTREYNGFSQIILAHNYGLSIDIPPMGESRMPKDSYDMAPNLSINYLQYMSWIEWMYNLNQYKLGYMLAPAIASGSFALNCAYFGIPCIGNKLADTQQLLFPELSIDVFDNEKALELTLRLKTDKDFYNKVSQYALETIKTEFSKEKFLETTYKSF